MSNYKLTWITEDLAVGYAPFSTSDLESVQRAGIGAIVNLCGEVCDLVELQETAGFEVYFLPVPDACAPDLEEMEKAMSWLDNSIRVGKKVLVHCRFGVGRTGTFVTAYLMKKGLDMKAAQKMLKKAPARPATHAQWKFLRGYRKKVRNNL